MEYHLKLHWQSQRRKR